ncbi:MAG: cache domain-containing protein [Deltaproteobacteria bacterium]|nr:cache domain-containing protein [Deltaproteobacteria bacterium]
MFSSLKGIYKVMLVLMALGVVPFVTIGTMSLIKSSGNLTAQVFDQLQGLRETKKNNITAFFKERERDLNVLCDIVEKFKTETGPEWTPQKMESFFSKYIDEYEYHDLFIIHPDGDVLYSVAGEADYGTNMITGPYADSNLGKLVRKVIRSRSFGMADFAPYAPSGNEPAAFVAEPVLKEKQVDLVIALQLSIEAINAIMMERTGLGKTGETYLVGPDMLMRSDSFLDPGNRSIRASFKDPENGSVDTDASREALAGKSGERVIIDYNGNPVLSAYTPVSLDGVRWALIAEMDLAEAFEAIDNLTWLISIVAVVGISTIVAVGLLIGLLFLNRPGRGTAGFWKGR